MLWLAVFLGGGLGSVGRLAVAIICTSWGVALWATPVVNILGSGLAAWLIGSLASHHDMLAAKWGDPGVARAFLVVGFCGGFTTFSALSVESILLFKDQGFWYGLAFSSLQVVLGFSLAAAILNR